MIDTIHTTRTMHVDDISDVRNVRTVCHPHTVSPADCWYFVNPTFVALVDDSIVGFTSFSVNVTPGHGEIMYGKDMCVLPDFRKYGIGESLHIARLAVARAAGVRIFMGVTSPDNIGMIKILKKYGAHACLPTGNGTLFVGLIPEV